LREFDLRLTVRIRCNRSAAVCALLLLDGVSHLGAVARYVL
jgi:hypothetical protein